MVSEAGTTCSVGRMRRASYVFDFGVYSVRMVNQVQPAQSVLSDYLAGGAFCRRRLLLGVRFTVVLGKHMYVSP